MVHRALSLKLKMYIRQGHQRAAELASRILTDVHSSVFLRVNGPFSNSDDFYKAFVIKPSEKLYRPDAERVKIW